MLESRLDLTQGGPREDRYGRESGVGPHRFTLEELATGCRVRDGPSEILAASSSSSTASAGGRGPAGAGPGAGGPP